MENNNISPVKYNVSEFVKFEGKDCVILDIKNNMFGYNDYHLWNVENGEMYVTTKSKLGKNKLETIDYLLLGNDFEEVVNQSHGAENMDLDDDFLLMASESADKDMSTDPSFSNRHSHLEPDDLDKLADANNEVSTTYSTKWAF